MSVLKITSENFEEEVLKSDKKVLIDFYADWCGPCKMMSPIIDQIAEEKAEQIKVGKVNVDENQELAMEYDVMSIPTIIIINNGEVEKTFIGVTDKNEIIQDCLEELEPFIDKVVQDDKIKIIDCTDIETDIIMEEYYEKLIA